MAVFVEGIIFIILSLTNVREAIFNAIPMTLKSAVSVRYRTFIAFIGLQNAKIVVNSDATLLTYQSFKGDTFHSIGIGAYPGPDWRSDYCHSSCKKSKGRHPFRV